MSGSSTSRTLGCLSGRIAQVTATAASTTATTASDPAVLVVNLRMLPLCTARPGGYIHPWWYPRCTRVVLGHEHRRRPAPAGRGSGEAEAGQLGPTRPDPRHR